MRKYALGLAGVVVNLALSISLAKGWADNIPNGLIICLYVFSLAPVAYWVITHEKLIVQRGWIRNRFVNRPITFIAVAALLFIVVISSLWTISEKVRIMLGASKPPAVETTRPIAEPGPEAKTKPAPLAPSPEPKPIPAAKPIKQPSIGVTKVVPSTQSVGSVDCQANQGNCAGINNGTQQTNYGVPQPPPQLLDVKMEDAPPVPGATDETCGAPLCNFPSVRLTFKVDRQFSTPEFLVFADKPCVITYGLAYVPNQSFSVMGPNEVQFEIRNNPHACGVYLKSPGMIVPGMEVLLIVHAIPKEETLKVQGVIAYVAKAQ